MNIPLFATTLAHNPPRPPHHERFLLEMDRILPWPELTALVHSCYASPLMAQPPRPPLDTMLRIYLLQHWFGHDAAGIEESLYEIKAWRLFTRLQCPRCRVPSALEISAFADLLEDSGVAKCLQRY